MGDNSFAGINFNDPQTNAIFKNRDKTICSSWSSAEDKGEIATVKIMKNDKDNTIVLNGVLNSSISLPTDSQIKYWAANSPTFNGSFSGSGLPFPNENVAFTKSKNSGLAKINGENFSFNIKTPNSYYKNMGALYVDPEVKIQVVDKNEKGISKIQSIKVANGIPFRTLTWPVQRDWNNGPMFYYNPHLTVRSQYQILLDSAYNPNEPVPNNFWGNVPPC
jgi:hypothetical protein